MRQAGNHSEKGEFVADVEMRVVTWHKRTVNITE